jgi:hypothetical protein
MKPDLSIPLFASLFFQIEIIQNSAQSNAGEARTLSQHAIQKANRSELLL